MRRLFAIATTALLVVLATAVPARHALAADGQVGVVADDDAVYLHLRDVNRAYATQKNDPVSPYEWMARNLCWSRYPDIEEPVSKTCDGNGPAYDVPMPCTYGEPLEPLWRRLRGTRTWDLMIGWHCPADLLPVLTQEDLRRLPIPAPAAHSQPEGGKVLVNKETIAYTEAEPVTLRTDLLGYGIDVEATPTHYTWDFGDGTPPLTTTHQGHPWPGFDIYHVYDTTGPMHMTLTTTWTARYRLDADPTHTWHDVTGTATTTSLTPDFELIELRPHLVPNGST